MSTPNFTDFEYYISYRAAGSGDGGWVETNQPATVHPFIVSGLTAGTTYEFRVRKRRKATGFSKFSTSLTATMSNTENSTTTGQVATYSEPDADGNYTSTIGGTTTKRNAQKSESQFAAPNWNYVLLDYTLSATSRKLAVMNSNTPNTLTAEVTGLGYVAGNTQQYNSINVLTRVTNKEILVSLPGTIGFTITFVDKGGPSKLATVIYFPPLPA